MTAIPHLPACCGGLPRRFAAALGMTAALVLSAACAKDAGRTGPSNQLLIVGYDREPDTMNRYATHILEDIQSCVVEGLVTSDERMNIIPYAGLYADYATQGDTATLAGLGLGGTPAAAAAVGGVSGRVIAGVTMELEGGGKLRLGGEIGGLGATVQNWSVEAGFKQPF